MKRLSGSYLLLIASLGLCGCVPSLSSQPPPTKRTAGFWYWGGTSAGTGWAAEPVDVLFAQAGNFSAQSQSVYAEIPDELPPAKQYWLVFRFGQQGVPDLQLAPALGRAVSRLSVSAQRRHLDVAGVQLDIDCPTAALPQYAAFLREFRKTLPQGWEISITALLDWFRSGTAIADVIQQADEFVPQFYDAASPASGDSRSTIATRIDAPKWEPVFNRFRKRFRIGISTFGRARVIPAAAEFYGDLAPIDVATNSAFQLQASRNLAQELVLRYRATTRTRVGDFTFRPGDTAQVILATPESIRAAVESAQIMGGYFAGVVFFRWPGSYERLTMEPDQVLIAAGLRGEDRRTPLRVQAIDGRCAAVACVDLYLEGADAFSPKPARYRIRTSTPLEYFLPEANMPVRMSGASEIELSIPPYSGQGRLYLGRAVTSNPAQFTVEGEQ